ncbi:MAG: sulfotransferase [Candidatus Brocadiaceae bacterium]
MNVNPILVTGSHRSGTTWVGAMLAISPPVIYVPEVFNVDHGVLHKRDIFKYWFTYIDEENEHKFRDTLENVFRVNYGLKYYIGMNTPDGRSDLSGVRGRLKLASKFLTGIGYHKRALLKDPIALFSAEWLAKEFAMDIVVLIRHPCAFVQSLQRVNWRFNFNNFLEQKKLMERYLYPFEEELREKHTDIITEGALLWKCLHHVIALYKNKYPNWIFRRLEDVSMNPVDEFRTMSNRLNIPFTRTMEKNILKYSDPSNPAEASRDVVFSLKRDSKTAVKIWKKRLSEKEVARIRKKVGEVAYNFYSEEDW